jgi:hypothetical protein
VVAKLSLALKADRRLKVHENEALIIYGTEKIEQHS